MQHFEEDLRWTQKQLKKWTAQWKAEVARIKENGQQIFLEAKSLELKKFNNASQAGGPDQE